MAETAEKLLKIEETSPPAPALEPVAKTDLNTNPKSSPKKSKGRNARRYPIHDSFWAEFKSLMRAEGLDADSFYKAGLDGSTLQKLREWFNGVGGPMMNMAPQTCVKLIDMIDNSKLYRSEIRSIKDMRMMVKSGI